MSQRPRLNSDRTQLSGGEHIKVQNQVSVKMSLTLRPPKKRGRIRGLFGRSASPSPNYPTVTPPRTPSPGPLYTTNGSEILADALETLTIDDRETIKPLLLPTNAISIDNAFNEVHVCARNLQQRCTIKRWSWNYRGRQVYLADQVDKVMRLLDKFKAMGDVVANIDPIHVGLPWVGIRAILEVCICKRNIL
jgi:hypothetical protein